MDTIFDKIIRKEIKVDIVFEDDDIIAFNDINPQAPVHVLVIPKKKISGFDQVRVSDEKDMGIFLKGISKVADTLGLSKDGYRVVFNSGKNGQQTVDYIHAHILGKRQMKWPPG